MSVYDSTDISFAISDYTKLSDINQVKTEAKILKDIDSKGNERPWKDKKQRSLKLADSYFRIGKLKKSTQVKFCSSQLLFNQCPTDGYKKLIGASFCKDRLCPMCNWRRSKMLAKQITDVLHEANRIKPMAFIFLTLTVKNCKGEELPQKITDLFKAFKRLFERKEVDKITIGFVRNLEITRNKRTGEYHPHFHILIGVPKSYFKKADYIKQDRWIELWKESLRVDYNPSVDISKVKAKRPGQTIEAAAIETGKYAVKDSDYLIEKVDKQTDSTTIDIKNTDEAVKFLSDALKNRRLVSYGKLFKQVKKDMKLKDIEDENADLIGEDETGCTCPMCQTDLVKTLYTWRMGLSDYELEEF